MGVYAQGDFVKAEIRDEISGESEWLWILVITPTMSGGWFSVSWTMTLSFTRTCGSAWNSP